MNTICNLITELATRSIQGESNPLETYVTLKRVEKCLNDAIKAVQEDAIAEAGKHPEKTLSLYGAKIEKKNGAGRWDFSSIEDWINLKEKLKAVEVGAQEAFKVWQKGGTISDADGVVIQPAGYVPGREIISITLDK